MAEKDKKAPDPYSPREVLPPQYFVCDQVPSEDSLGFKPYVSAVCRFLTNESTKAPLTISVEGEWGAGKSTFMDLLAKDLQEKGKTTVNFNAWRHDSEEALWAAFAIQFWEQTTASLGWWRRPGARWRLFARRFQWWTAIWRSMRDTLLFLIVLALASFILCSVVSATDKTSLESFSWLERLNQFVAVFKSSGIGVVPSIIISAVIFLSRGVWESCRSFSEYVSQFVDSPRYEERVSFIEQFHDDFAEMVRSVAGGGNGTVYVFIDDLDRCEVPKAAELMQALNLMISNNASVVFIMGMDREKIAAGFAAKQEKLLPYLSALKPTTNGRTKERFGIEHGYTFIEKFIQIPFLVPKPTESQLREYLDKSSMPTEERGRKGSQEEKPGPLASSGEKDDVKMAEMEQQRESIRERVLAWHDINEIVNAVAPALDSNPRRFKQFVNLFRFRTLIAVETGLFDGEEPIFLEQLGKFVAIQLRWPLLIADLERFPELLRDFELRLQEPEKSHAKMPESCEHWLEREKLRSLLEIGLGDGVIDEAWSMGGLDVSRILQVLPQVRTVPSPSEKEGEQKPGPKTTTPSNFITMPTATATPPLVIRGGIPQFLVGTWDLKYEKRGSLNPETAVIDADGNYYANGRHTFRLDSIKLSKDRRKLEFRKVRLSNTVFQEEVLELSEGLTRMEGHATRDGHKLIYTKMSDDVPAHDESPEPQ